MPEPAARCAVHPARPAVDVCPVCARPRCAADAATAAGGGCAACRGSAAPAPRPPLGATELLRAAAACGAAVPLLGAIGSQYVDSGAMAYVVPALVGVAVGALAEAVARRARGTALRWLAAGYALLAAGYGFGFVPGRVSPFTPLRDVWWSYAAAAIGAWLWTAPPRRPGQTRSRRKT